MTQQTITGEPTFESAVRAIHTELGGRARSDDVLNLMHERHPDLLMRAAWKKLGRAVAGALTSHDTAGMPFAASVDNQGTYVQRSLFGVEDYQSVIGGYCGRANQNIDVAHKLADECSDKFGIRPDVDGQISATQAAQ